MGIHVTRYETKDGKTRKVGNKNGAAGKSPGADGKTRQPESPVKQGAANGQ